MNVRQLMIPLIVEKSEQMPANVTTLITLKLEYTGTSFQIQLRSQDKTMIFIDTFGK